MQYKKVYWTYFARVAPGQTWQFTNLPTVVGAVYRVVVSAGSDFVHRVDYSSAANTPAGYEEKDGLILGGVITVSNQVIEFFVESLAYISGMGSSAGVGVGWQEGSLIIQQVEVV